MRALASTLLLLFTVGGCTRRAAPIEADREADSGSPHETGDRSPADDALTEGAIAVDPEANAWQRECAVVIARAVRIAAKRDPRFAMAVVATGEFIEGRREVYLERAPEGFRLQVVSKLVSEFSSGTSSGGWLSEVGTVDAGRQLRLWRYTPGAEATLTFQGCQPSDEAVLAPAFKTAADACIQL